MFAICILKATLSKIPPPPLSYKITIDWMSKCTVLFPVTVFYMQFLYCTTTISYMHSQYCFWKFFICTLQQKINQYWIVCFLYLSITWLYLWDLDHDSNAWSYKCQLWPLNVIFMNFLFSWFFTHLFLIHVLRYIPVKLLHTTPLF